MRKRSAQLIALCALLVAMVPSAARAHGDLQKSEPEKGTRLSTVPPKVSVTLTEAPSDARLRVRDGCGRLVAGRTQIAGRRVVAEIVTSAQPGKWTVRFQAVSSVDNHISDGTFAFTVRGRRDCTKDKEPSASPSPSASATHAAGSAATDDNGQSRASGEGGNSGIPIVVMVLGAGALVVTGIGLRRLLSH